ncbi:MAG: PP2C family protein-serine/threonine phosphatase [Chloroflexota bacterium]
MLARFATQHNTLLRNLAADWQSAGAQGFALLDGHKEGVFAEGVTTGECLDAPLGGLGLLRVTYAQNPPAEARPLLAGQARLLAQLLKQEIELDGMTVELMGAYDQLVAMYNVSQASRAHLEVDDQLRSLLNEAIRLTGAQRGFVILGGDPDPRCVTCADPHPHRKDFGPGFLRYVQAKGRSLLCNTAQECRAEIPQMPADVERFSVTPVKVDEQVVAAIGLLNKPSFFTAGNQKLLSALAEEASAILERHQLQQQLIHTTRMERELEIAASIQSGMLPREIPAVPGVQLSGAFRPANEVGGDFYDVIPLDDGRLALVLGDVTSKGVPAALFMTVTRTVLRSTVAHYRSPQSVLQRLSDDLYEDFTQAGMFVTLFLAFYDPSTRELTYANAGHSPVIFFRRTRGACEFWEADGPPVGVLDVILSQDERVTLQEGDFLAVMSDGFNEAVNPAGEMWGNEALVATLTGHASESAQVLQQTLFAGAAAFSQNAPQADDQTVIILKAVAPSRAE